MKGQLDGSRFFAKLRTFDLACPRCGRVSIVRKAYSRRWSTRTQRWSCRHCSLSLVLGLIAWQVYGGRAAVPPDSQATAEEVWAIDDQEQRGVVKFTRRGRGDQVNVVTGTQGGIG
jgi:predicted RNA-binding Zn-ribbon protein involved in translation (DUF1610 family)